MANPSIFELADLFGIDSPLTAAAPVSVSLTIDLQAVTVARGVYTLSYVLSPTSPAARFLPVTVTLRAGASQPPLATRTHTLGSGPTPGALTVRATQLQPPPGTSLAELSLTLLASGAGFTASSGTFQVQPEAEAALAQREQALWHNMPGLLDIERPAAPAPALGAALPDLSAWRELLNFKVPAAVTRSLAARNLAFNQSAAGQPQGKAELRRTNPFFVQQLASGYGEINVDYYPVRVIKKPLSEKTGQPLTAEQFCDHLRRNINKVVDPNAAHFDAYSDADAERWYSADPLTSVFSIPLGGGRVPFLHNLMMEWFKRSLYFRPDHGAVIASAVTPLYWRFSTISTANDYGHAISGTREFGVAPDGDEYSFYVRGIDRAATLADLVANNTLFNFQFDIQNLTNIIWNGADKLWRSMQLGVVAEVARLKGKAIIMNTPTPARRFAWEAVKRQYIRP